MLLTKEKLQEKKNFKFFEGSSNKDGNDTTTYCIGGSRYTEEASWQLNAIVRYSFKNNENHIWLNDI